MSATTVPESTAAPLDASLFDLTEAVVSLTLENGFEMSVAPATITKQLQTGPRPEGSANVERPHVDDFVLEGPLGERVVLALKAPNPEKLKLKNVKYVKPNVLVELRDRANKALKDAGVPLEMFVGDSLSLEPEYWLVVQTPAELKQLFSDYNYGGDWILKDTPEMRACVAEIEAGHKINYCFN